MNQGLTQDELIKSQQGGQKIRETYPFKGTVAREKF